ncbi:MAG: SMC-Scp complex subunit ScpB [Glaciihabitans sp.]|nr:SMC-Scp complex subunit ScpB [Glaciihabitans sp.]
MTSNDLTGNDLTGGVDVTGSQTSTSAAASVGAIISTLPAPQPHAPIELDRALEAILMVSDEPQSLVSMASALSVPVSAVRKGVARLVADFDGVDGTIKRGFQLREVAGGWRIYVRSEFDEVARDFVLTQNPTKLSQAALETLAVIAYKQPISRASIAAIRAVNVDSVVRTLLGRGLITEAYTDSETGAIHYATTDVLLTQLGLNSIGELPHISPLLDDGTDGFDDFP